MPVLRVAAVQAAYVLMDRNATIDLVAALAAAAAREGAQLVVFPVAFVPGTPVWIDIQPIWDGDEEWFGLLARHAVVIGDPGCDRLAARNPGRTAPEAHPDRIGTDCLGHGRRVHAPRDGYRQAPDRRPDLLGELHAAGPVPPVRAGPRRVDRAHPGDGRRLDLDLDTVAVARRYLDPVGHYDRPDILRLSVDSSPRPAVTELNR